MSRMRTAAALFLAALCFRPQLVGVAPLLPAIQESLHISHAVSGLLVTVPVLCMGVFAPAGRTLARRLNARAAVTALMVLLAAAGLARAGTPADTAADTSVA